jgi:hypothetical protein
MLAYVNIKQEPHYRRDAFVDGLKKLGYGITFKRPAGIGEGDVYVSWNLHGQSENEAAQFKKAGAKILVTENGYCGLDKNGRQYYALARDGHNGSGLWVDGGEDRWTQLGIELKPWNVKEGGHILICGQRGIGSKRMASPTGWHDQIAAKIRNITKLPVRIRHHPGATPRTYRHGPLEGDLKGASRVIIWSSGSGVKALIAGIPVAYDAPHWICQDSAAPFSLTMSSLEPLTVKDSVREATFKKMAHAQWSVDELSSGEPFKRLLEIK